MFEKVLVEQNPHWEGAQYPYIVERECFKDILRYLPLSHVIAVTGVRRAGKSTLLKQIINFLIQKEKVPATNILFANLEHPYFNDYCESVQYLEYLFEDYLKIANPRGKIFCLLDEVQFFNNWPLFVKAHYEQKDVKFIITGSNSHLMSHELLTLLSGRTLPIEVYPLSFGEIIQAKTAHPLTARLFAQYRQEIRRLLDGYLRFGGFPEIALLEKADLAYDILNAYAKTILYQDVASRLSLKKPVQLERLFYYLASHISDPFFYASLAKLFNLTDKTIKEYIQALIDANLLFEVDQFSFSLKQQIRTPKKIYAVDTGMVNAIAFQFSENRGKLFENLVFLELKRRNKEIFYYKTKEGYEVDFLTKEKGQLELLQVCIDMHERSEPREIRALYRAAAELGLKSGILITADREKQWVEEGVTLTAIPLYQWLVCIAP